MGLSRWKSRQRLRYGCPPLPGADGLDHLLEDPAVARRLIAAVPFAVDVNDKFSRQGISWFMRGMSDMTVTPCFYRTHSLTVHNAFAAWISIHDTLPDNLLSSRKSAEQHHLVILAAAPVPGCFPGSRGRARQRQGQIKDEIISLQKHASSFIITNGILITFSGLMTGIPTSATP
jgi:hypothetical protein